MPVGASIAATAGSAIAQGAAGASAAKSAKQAADKNLAFNNKVYGDAQGNLQPTIGQGQQAGSALAGLLGIGGDPAASARAFDNFRNSTNYNFLFNQGTNATKTANAPSFNSGATAKALINYGQGMAGNALSGYENMLAGQQGLGAQSALGLAGVGTNIAGQNAAANNSAAGAAGGAAITGANAFGNALAGLNQTFQQNRSESSFGGQQGASAFGNALANSGNSYQGLYGGGDVPF